MVSLFRRRLKYANRIPTVKYSVSHRKKSMRGINLTCSIRNQNRRMWYLRILLESLQLHCSKGTYVTNQSERLKAKNIPASKRSDIEKNTASQ